MTIKAKMFQVTLTGGRSEFFDQDLIYRSSVEVLSIGVSQFVT